VNVKKNQIEVSGFSILKKNLEEHLDDLHRWQFYLDKSSDIDLSDFRPTILSELPKEDFQKQLSIISEKLAKENDELVSMLKVKQAEAEAKKLQEKKKKDRKKTTEN